MALKTAPTVIQPDGFRLSAVTASVITRSPFSYAQQVIRHSGDMWMIEASIPRIHRTYADEWIAFLMSLKGPVNTFLFGDPNASQPRGTITAASVTGSSGDDSVTLTTATGDFAAGDYFQLGTGTSSELYKVLEAGGSGDTVDIFPRLRSDRSSVSATVTNAKGHFRLVGGDTSFVIDSNSQYEIQFSAMEVL